jgi:surface protein
MLFITSSRLVAAFNPVRRVYFRFLYYQMFYLAAAFDHDLSPWNVDAVTTMQSMFNGATAFSQTLCWTIPGGADVTDMFAGSSGSIDGTGTGICLLLTNTNFKTACDAWVGGDTATYGLIKDWKTYAVTDMSNAFNGATSFNDDISAWDVSSVTTMELVSNEPTACCFGALRKHFAFYF